MDKHPLKKYPLVGACGLNCGLCPMHHTESKSRCPGCCGPGFREVHPSCSIITCCVKQRGLEICAQCDDWAECEKIGKRLEFGKHRDSVISYRPVPANFAFIQKKGIGEFARLEMEKENFLKYLLQNYDDGRSKSFFCTSCQLLPLDKLKEAAAGAETQMSQGSDIKEKARIVREAIIALAETLQIDLKLRK